MKGQCAQGQIETLQPQRRKTKDNPEQGSNEPGGREGDKDGGFQLFEEYGCCERPSSNETCMAQRDLPGVSCQQHQRYGANERQEDLRG